MPETTDRPMRRIVVKRTYLVRTEQTYAVDIPADYDTDEWLVNDFAGFDEAVCNTGELLSESYEPVDDDGLDLEVEGPRCSECSEIHDTDDPHAGYGMCASCLHDALRSGWDPNEKGS